MMIIKLFLLLFPAILTSSVAEVFYVTPTTSANPSCSSPCHTLGQYAQDHTLFGGHANITMVFLSGQHNLSYDLPLSGVDELTMQRQENTTMDVFVNLQAVQIHLNISTHLMIHDITFRSGNTPKRCTVISTLAQTISLLYLTLNGVTLNFQRVKSSTSKLEDTTNINITSTNFIGPGSNYLFSHGILIIYHHLTSLIIQNSTFTNYYCGVHIESSQVNIYIKKTQFAQNAFGIHIYQSHGKVIIADSYIIEGANYWRWHNRGLPCGVFTRKFQGQITVTATWITKCQYGIYCILTNLAIITNTTVSNSKNFAVLLITSNASIRDSYVTDSRVGIASVVSAVHIQNTLVSTNENGMVIPAEDLNIKFLGTPDNNIGVVNSITNCTFSSNNLVGLFLINYRGNVQLRDSKFSRNHGSSIFAYQSRFKLLGETIFGDNTADRGGGLALYNSTVTFGLGSSTQFINNTAREFGGAIYIVSLPAVLPDILINIESIPDKVVYQLQVDNTLLRQSCFYETDKNASVNFMKNNAELGGLDIYGPTLYTDDCSLSNKSFVFDDEVTHNSRISSDPSRVCFCDNDNQCNATAFPEINETRYPGEKFSIPVALTGYNFGRVAGSVYTNVVDQNYKKVIDDNQHVQTANDIIMNCTSLKYRIISQEKQTSRVTLVLTAQDQLTQRKSKLENMNDFSSSRCNKLPYPPCVARLTTPAYINVNLEGCPLGFMFHSTTGICDCDQIIKNLSMDENNPLTCEIQNRTGYIKRRGKVWIGVSTSDLYYLYGNCSRDYCNTPDVMVDLREPDSQCRLDRSGVLCGSCQSGYSLQLGSNHCKLCNHKNNNISLLVVFATLGILLVIILTTLDLTVAKGTINGLIFYANIVWINNAELFPAKEQLSPGYYIIPIAWINLDFGIETCFSENLDQLAKSGMQFVFPVYIWCIAGLIIIVCHYSTRATRLFGNNSVAVLATLFLLSYGKLFRSITDAFIPAYVANSTDNTRSTVWALDGNIMYNDSRHISLIVVALLFLILFWLPFTLTLLLVPLFRAISDKKPFLWINKLQPFFDTYYGPFKFGKKFQIWTGILLLSRVVLLVIYAATSNDFPMVNVILMAIMASILLVYTALVSLLYKNWYLSLLEILYLLNLIILSAFFVLFPQTNDKDNIATVVTLSVCVALFQFACTIVYHVLKRILAIERIQTCIKKVQTSIKPNLEQGTMVMNESTVHVDAVKRVSTSSDLRESLLSDTF